jgi:polyisoprenoid-binding protein YceI
VDSTHFNVEGNLTIRDVTKPVALDVEYLGMGPVAIGGRDLGTQVGFQARTTVNRKDFGIVWNKTVDQGGVMLGDDVEIVIAVAAFTAPPAPTAQTPGAADKKKK